MTKHTNKHKNTPTKQLALMPPVSPPHQDYYNDEWLEWTRAICSLNDAFRLTFTSTELYCSPELMKLPVDEQSAILDRVRNFRSFNEFNDPHMCHNQGFFLYEDLPIVWTIYYHEDENTKPYQLNPVNIDLTKRHMMIMTASEWWEKLPENIF